MADSQEFFRLWPNCQPLAGHLFRTVSREHLIAAYKILSCFHRVPDGTNTSDAGAAGSCECERVTWLLPRSEVDNLDTDPASAQLLPKATLCELDNLGS